MENFTLAKHENYADWHKSTRDFFDQASHTDSCYWIIDPCSSPELPAAIWEIDPDTSALPLYMNTYLEDVVRAGPMLIPYSGQSKLTAWLFRQMEIRPLGYLVQAGKEQAAGLFEHFQNLLECISPKSTKSLFRFYDPRIMYAITTYPIELVKEQILGPVLNLCGWEHGRRVAILAGDGTDHFYRCAGIAKSPEALFEHIWEEVQIHTLIEELKDKFVTSHPSATFFELYDELEKVYKFIKENGYSDLASFKLAATITALYSNKFWNNEQVLHAFAMRKNEDTLSDVIESIGR